MKSGRGGSFEVGGRNRKRKLLVEERSRTGRIGAGGNSIKPRLFHPLPHSPTSILWSKRFHPSTLTLTHIQSRPWWIRLGLSIAHSSGLSDFPALWIHRPFFRGSTCTQPAPGRRPRKEKTTVGLPAFRMAHCSSHRVSLLTQIVSICSRLAASVSPKLWVLTLAWLSCIRDRVPGC